MSYFDSIKMAVEGCCPNNTIILDDLELPSFMVRIPKFRICDVIDGGSDTTHPAFIINGVEIPEIYIGKYQSVVKGDRAYSLPGQDPHTHVNIDQARRYCQNKGKGWHLVTNAEWAAIALWCKKNGFLPRGNTDHGQNHIYRHEHGVISYRYLDGGEVREGRVATGSGPVTWAHDGSPAGIFDLCGNVWEWTSGFRLKSGQIQIIPNNDSALCVDESTDSPLWRAISVSGDLIDPCAEGSLYFDSTVPGDDLQTNHEIGGTPILNTTIEYPLYTGGMVDSYFATNACAFKDLTAKPGVNIPEILHVLAIMPLADYTGEGRFGLRNYGERLPLRGGNWLAGSQAGLFALPFDDNRMFSTHNLGFRVAFIKPDLPYHL